MTEPRPRVLIAGAARAAETALRKTLQAGGFDTTSVANLAEIPSALRAARPDAILAAPAHWDGPAWVARLREATEVPLLIVSDPTEEGAVVAALDAGADDWMGRPVGSGELAARVRATLRRRGALAFRGGLLQSGGLIIDIAQRRVTRAGRPVRLTPTEYALLKALAEAGGRVCTHAELLRRVWGRGYEHAQHILRVNIANLRRKLEPDRAHPVHVVTVAGAGYRLHKPVRGVPEAENARLTVQAVRAALAEGWLRTARADHAGALEAFQEAATLAQDALNPDMEADADLGLAFALVQLRRFDAARAHVECGRRLADAAGNDRHLVRVHHVLGLIARHERRFEEAAKYLLDGFRRYLETGHPDQGLGAMLLHHLGDVHLEQGDHVEAGRWYEQALAILEPAEELQRAGLSYLQRGTAERRCGEYDAALATLTRGRYLFETAHDVRLLGGAHHGLGVARLAQGRVDDAIGHFQASLDIKAKTGDEAGQVRTLTELGRAFAVRRAFHDAERAFAEAGRLAAKFEDAAATTRIQFASAQLCEATGRQREAIRLYQRAVAGFDALDMRGDSDAASAALGQLLIAQERASEAAPYLAKAVHAPRPNFAG